MSNVDDIRAGSADYYIHSLKAEVEQIRKMRRRLEDVRVWEAYAASLHRAQAKEIAPPQELSFREVHHALNLLSRAQVLLEKASRGIANQNNKSSKT